MFHKILTSRYAILSSISAILSFVFLILGMLTYTPPEIQPTNAIGVMFLTAFGTALIYFFVALAHLFVNVLYHPNKLTEGKND